MNPTHPPFAYVLFFTSAAAFRAERVARDAGIAGARLVPTPRSLSSDCGAALRLDEAAAEAVATLLLNAAVPFDRIERVS